MCALDNGEKGKTNTVVPHRGLSHIIVCWVIGCNSSSLSPPFPRQSQETFSFVFAIPCIPFWHYLLIWDDTCFFLNETEKIFLWLNQDLAEINLFFFCSFIF